MTTHAEDRPRRRRAALVGLGFDGRDRQNRIITGEHCLMIGGSEQTQDELLEVMLRLESELERLGRPLGEVAPEELAEVALRIDSPELHAIAVQLADGLARTGRTFQEATVEELTELSARPAP